MNNNVLSQVAALKTMETVDLKKKWKELYDTDPPPFNRVYLESRLAYRLQELAFGGLKKETVKRIAALRQSMISNEPLRPQDRNQPPIGAILVREHRGVEHRVRVLRDGFEYEGKIYRSLTAIARHITGVHWNGPMFFGLRRKG